ncbi:hypothetical protein [Pantoea sp. MQR6]|uniref:hypothetical protein n=1 Tax=Pantoea sp. MQR6 TaxID=2907307 RepID=UPI001FA9FF3C|nr:hypothetical protein [Pantoea sp. MQR6]
MARRKKDDNALGVILVILGVIAWGIYVAVRALINVNERFIDSVSTPAGIIATFFGASSGENAARPSGTLPHQQD